MTPEHEIYIETWKLVKKVDLGVRFGKFSPGVLERFKDSFVEILHDPLSLSPADGLLVGRLALASAKAPVSRRELTRYIKDQSEDGVLGSAVTEQETKVVVDSISRLKRVMPESTGLRIHRVVGIEDQEVGWYLGLPRFTLTDKESQVMALLVAGFTRKEIAVRVQATPRTVLGELANIYAKLRVKGRTEAALLLLEDHSVDTKSLMERIDLSQFGLLGSRKIDVMEALMNTRGGTNEEIARIMGRSVTSIKNYITYISGRLAMKGAISRTALVAGYALYKQDHKK